MTLLLGNTIISPTFNQSIGDVDVDNITINKNTNNELQSIGIINPQNNNAMSIWQGTEEQWEQYQSINLYNWLSSNYVIIGSEINIDNNIVSGFSSSNYLQTNNIEFGTYGFTLKTKFRLDSFASSGAFPSLFTSNDPRFILDITNPGHVLKIDLGTVTLSLTSSIQIDTDYWVVLTRINDTLYLGISTDGENYTFNSTTISSSTSLGTISFNIGIGRTLASAPCHREQHRIQMSSRQSGPSR